MNTKSKKALEWTNIAGKEDILVSDEGAIFMEANIPELTVLTPMPHIMPNFDGMSRQYITRQQALNLIPDKEIDNDDTRTIR